MKVNIRYTVDLDEVLEDMSQVYYKSLNKLETKLDFYDNVLGDGFNESDLEQIILALEQYLEFYHDHQTKISEVLNILNGYKCIRDGTIKPPTAQAQDGEAQ